MKNKILVTTSVILFLLILGSIIYHFATRYSNTGRSVTGETTRSYLMGIGPIPKDFPDSTQNDWLDMFYKTREVSEIVLAQTEWRDSVETSGKIPKFLELIADQRKTYGYEPVFGINFFQGEGSPILNTIDNPINDWTNNDAVTKYGEVALAICKKYRPLYLSLATEVNTYYHSNHQDFDRFIMVYKALYREIKQNYPETKVFVTFQLEKIKGIGVSTWGYLIDPQWQIFRKFGNTLDLIAFTTFPEVQFDSPDEIPENYYTDIIGKLPGRLQRKKIAFTEVGWSATKYIEEDQNNFMSTFLALTRELNVEFSAWVYMHDIKGDASLTKMGLRTSSSEARDSWLIWKSLRAEPYSRPD